MAVHLPSGPCSPQSKVEEEEEDDEDSDDEDDEEEDSDDDEDEEKAPAVRGIGGIETGGSLPLLTLLPGSFLIQLRDGFPPAANDWYHIGCCRCASQGQREVYSDNRGCAMTAGGGVTAPFLNALLPAPMRFV